jgi:hypothetical protein
MKKNEQMKNYVGFQQTIKHFIHLAKVDVISLVLTFCNFMTDAGKIKQTKIIKSK